MKFHLKDVKEVKFNETGFSVVHFQGTDAVCKKGHQSRAKLDMMDFKTFGKYKKEFTADACEHCAKKYSEIVKEIKIHFEPAI